MNRSAFSNVRIVNRMNRTFANLLLLITAMIWGTGFVAQHEGLNDLGPFSFTGLRFVLGTLVVLPLGYLEYKRRTKEGYTFTTIDKRDMVLCGIFLFLGSLTQQIGLKWTTVTNAGFFTGLYVVMVPLLMMLFLKKKPHWSLWFVIMGCMFATYLLIGGELDTLNVGDAFVSGGALFWALQVITIGYVVMRTHAPLMVATVQFGVSSIAGLILMVIFENPSIDNVIQAGPALLFAGVLSIGVAFTLQCVAQRYTEQSDAAILLSGEILFAALAGAYFLNEELDMMGYFGCLLMFICIVSVELLALYRRKKAPVPA